MVVSLAYEVFDEEDELVGDSSTDPIEVVFGYGQLLAALEQAIDKALPGTRRSVELAPEEAYGEWDRKAVIEVDASEFPAGTEPGDHFEAENAEGMVLLFKVLDVTPQAVLLDTNHPLAGQRVRFSLEVLAVRPASEQELEAAVARALTAEQSDESSKTHLPHLISPQQLLIRQDRR